MIQSGLTVAETLRPIRVLYIRR